MKKLCRIVSGALAALFAAALLAGCSEEGASGSSDAPSAAPTGGYVEEDVSPDHNYNVGLFVVDGVLNAFTVETPPRPSPNRRPTGTPWARTASGRSRAAAALSSWPPRWGMASLIPPPTSRKEASSTGR